MADDYLDPKKYIPILERINSAYPVTVEEGMTLRAVISILEEHPPIPIGYDAFKAKYDRDRWPGRKA